MNYASGYHELAQIIKGVPIQCMVINRLKFQVRVKPSVGYQREDLRISGNRLGILDVNNRSNDRLLTVSSQGGVRVQRDFHS